jgi:hypothetical protein
LILALSLLFLAQCEDKKQKTLFVKGRVDTIVKTIRDTIIIKSSPVKNVIPTVIKENKEKGTKIYKQEHKDSLINLTITSEGKEIENITYDYSLKIPREKEMVFINTTDTLIETKKLYRKGLYASMSATVPFDSPLDNLQPFVGLHYQDKSGMIYGVEKNLTGQEINISIKMPLFHKRK